MRLILAMADPDGAILTALLGLGHHAQRHAAAGRLLAWRVPAAVAAFRPDAVLADGEAGELLARRLGVPALRPQLDAAFLADPFPPPPFGPARRAPPELGLRLPEPPPPALLPDIVLLNPTTIGQAPRWMAAARPIVAPAAAAPVWLEDEETALLHAGDPAPALARLVADPALCDRLGAAARRRFERLREEALAALRRIAP